MGEQDHSDRSPEFEPLGTGLPAGRGSAGPVVGGSEGTIVGDLPTRVFDDLFDRIIGGALPSGGRLPSERALTEQLGVNRQVVREALKRLTQLGLITADRNHAHLVEDWRRTGSFDLVPLLVARALGDRGPQPLLTARHLLELRLVFAVSVAQLCITNATDEQLAQLVTAAAEVGRMRDVTQRFSAEWKTWALAAEGSGNVAIVLMLNSLRSAAGPGLLLMARASHTVPGDPADLAAAVQCIAARDALAADLAVRHLYRIEPTDELRAAEEQVTAQR